MHESNLDTNGKSFFPVEYLLVSYWRIKPILLSNSVSFQNIGSCELIWQFFKAYEG